MKRVIKAASETKKTNISEITKELKKKSKYITVDRKYCDQVCEILDGEDVAYTFDSCDKGKCCKFHIDYNAD